MQHKHYQQPKTHQGPTRGEAANNKQLKSEKLLEMIGDRPLAEKTYLTNRWLEQLLWWNTRAWRARRWFFCLRYIIIIGGVLLPFLISTELATATPCGRYLASVVGLLVAASAGIEALHNWGGIWLEKRKAVELLTVEGCRYLAGAGIYEDSATSFKRFVEVVESQIAAEVGDYVKVAKPPDHPTPGPSEDEKPKKP